MKVKSLLASTGEG